MLMTIANGSNSVHYVSKPDTVKVYTSGPAVRQYRDQPDRILRFWTEDSWATNETKSLFHLDTDGIVTVTEAGVYMIYMSVTYHDLTGRWSAAVLVSGIEKAKCLASEQLRDVSHMHQTAHGVYKQCSTTLVVYLRRNQHVAIQCMYGTRQIMTAPEFTFWGMVKLS